MPKRANSPRRASVSPTNACLLAQCSGSDGMPHRPQMLATFTTAGRQSSVAVSPLRMRCGWATRIISTGAKKFTSITRRTISSVEVANSPKLQTPAQLMSTSSAPNRATVDATILARSSGLVRSPGYASAWAPAARHSDTSLARSSAERAVRASLAPSFASRSAVRRPMPREAPVTSTTRPRRFRRISFTIHRLGASVKTVPSDDFTATSRDNQRGAALGASHVSSAAGTTVRRFPQI